MSMHTFNSIAMADGDQTETQDLTIERILKEDFFSLVGLQDITDEEKMEILESMNKTVQARAYLKVSEQLDPDERIVLDHKTGDELMQYLADKGIDLVNTVMEEAVKYRLELATLFQVATTPGALAASN